MRKEGIRGGSPASQSLPPKREDLSEKEHCVRVAAIQTAGARAAGIWAGAVQSRIARGPEAIRSDTRGDLNGPFPEASKRCRRPIRGLLADLGPRPGCAFVGRRGARIPKSLFVVRGCRGPAPRPCAQRATPLRPGWPSLRSQASRPRTRPFPPHGVRPRPGSPARIPALLVPGVWSVPASGEPARTLPGVCAKAGLAGRGEGLLDPGDS